jgi:hypothetical protein
MRFVETPVFTAALRGLLSPEAYRQLQLALVLRPEQGALIPGTSGLRKLRAATGRGKRGGSRIIYYWHGGEATFFMLFAYPKNAQEDLTPSQVRLLRRLVEEEFG